MENPVFSYTENKYCLNGAKPCESQAFAGSVQHSGLIWKLDSRSEPIVLAA
jgi:hypothetical protein